MDKVFDSASDALHDLSNGAVIMSGGFGLCGNPENLIRAVADRGVEGLTVISNNCGTGVVAHDAHHRGQMLLALKQNGVKVTDEVKWGLWSGWFK